MAPPAGVVHSDPDILGGMPVSVGTRVPVKSLFDYLEGGDTLDEFLIQFPSVKREQAMVGVEIGQPRQQDARTRSCCCPGQADADCAADVSQPLFHFCHL